MMGNMARLIPQIQMSCPVCGQEVERWAMGDYFTLHPCGHQFRTMQAEVAPGGMIIGYTAKQPLASQATPNRRYGSKTDHDGDGAAYVTTT